MDASDRTLMRDNLARLLDTGSQLERARDPNACVPAHGRAVWRELCASGWLGLLMPEAAGGIGADASDFVDLLEGIGRHLPPEPIGPAIVAARLLAQCDTPASRALLAAHTDGTAITLLAQQTTFPMPGHPMHVLGDAAWADRILVSDTRAGTFVLRVVRADLVDARWPQRPTMDDRTVRFLRADDPAAETLAEGAEIEFAVASAQNLLCLGAAATLCGIAQQVLDDLVAYLTLRHQFGVPIGSFQALQHRAATLHVACRASSALVREAALAIGTRSEATACAMAKQKATLSATAIVKESVQMHGAIGFTDELKLALYVRRAVALGSQFATPAECRRVIGRQHGTD